MKERGISIFPSFSRVIILRGGWAGQEIMKERHVKCTNQKSDLMV